jgi:hypothetical protein
MTEVTCGVKHFELLEETAGIPLPVQEHHPLISPSSSLN